MKIIWMLIVLLLFQLNCEDKEQIAQEIYDRAKALEAEDGKLLEALTVYDSLVEYKDTAVYAKAEQELLLKGYDIGGCLSSWTAKELIRMENAIIAFKEKYKRFPFQEELEKFTDAWGTELQITYNPKKNIHFFLYSPGEDGIDSTADDLVLAYLKKSEYEAAAAANKSNGELSLNLSDLEKYKNADQAAELKGTLKELEKFNNSPVTLNEKKVTLDNLAPEKKK